jgi:chitodextrinase
VLKNCLLNDNKAGLDGGGIYCDWGTKPTIINSTITGNEAKGDPPFGVGYGGGLYCSYESNVNIINSIVWGNAGPNTIGPELAVETWFGFNPTVLTVSYCDVEGGEGEMWVDGSSTLNWGTGNIDADPLFVDTDINEPTYYLSQVAAGQLNDSPCVNVGSNTAANLGMNTLTTRTDNVPDAGIVDLGYHYMAGTTIEYQLDIDVLTFDPNVGANGRLMAQADGDNPFEISDPDIRQVSQGTVVFLTAIPDPDYRVWYWEGTDDDTSKALTNTVTMNSDKKVFVAFEPDGKYYLFVKVKGEGTVAINPNPNTLLRSPGEVVTLTATPANPSDAIIWTGTDNDNTVGITNTVTMTGRKEVTVEFYTPRILYVGSDSGYPTLQAAIDAAHDMDVIQLMPSGQPYFTQDGYQIIGRNITITSVDPYDPAVVETTVIQQQVSPPASRPPAFAFYFVGPQMRVLGITIRGFSAGNYTMVDPEAPLYDGLHGITVPARGIQCYSASPTFINCVIDDCHSYGDNGSNGRGGDTGHINGGNGGWPGGAWGGAVYCGEYYIGYPSNPTFIGCTFSNNSAIGGNGADGGSGASPPNTGYGGKGGGWYYPERLVYSPWESPPGGLPKDHSGLGGAVFIDSDCSPTFEDCNFINNSSHGGLNGICGQDPPSNDREEPSIRYRIDNLGGAVYMKAGSAPTFTTCTFTDNTADTNKSPASFDDFLGFGGAVAMENGAKPTFVGCMFNNNISDIGGGMYSARSEPEITESNFIANTAYHGGGMLLIDGIAHITASLFSGNNANRPGSEGGAITVLGANAKIIDCSIYDNNSSGSGGGVYLSSKYFDGNESADGNSVLLKNCLIVGNTAVQNGGGVSANWHSEPNIVNCTIADNDAAGMGGGVYGGFNNYTNIINTILWDNFAPSGPQMAVGTTSAPSYMKVTYSDVQGGPGLVRVDPGSTLEWDVALDNPDYPTNIHADPLFVTGPRGYFYLSQVGAGQAQTSPCVDTGSAPAGNLGFTLYTTRTDESPDRGIVDMGYHFPILEECRFAETVKDGVVDLLDLAVLVDKWLNTSCGDANEWCGGADLSFDTTVDFDDYAILAGCWMAYDSIPPIPNPAQWEVEPYVLTSTSVNMKAVTEQDVLWGLAVDYNFVCESGNCHTSGWRAGREYNDVGLVPDVEYSYKIKARDVAGNETEWSTIRFVTTTTGPGPDTTPPTPNPMTWQIAPHSINPTTIEMKATIATDASGGIEYEFNEANGTALDSGWRADPCYTVTGLDPNSTYCFNVRAHDKYGNATAWSANGCVSPGVVVDVNAPTPAPSIVWSPDVNYITWVEPNTVSGQFMYTSPETEDGRWWHRVIANVAGITDDSGGPVEIRFICTTDSAYSSKNKVKTGGVSIPIYVGQPVAIGSRAVKWRVTYSNSGNYIVYEVDVDKFGGSGKKLFWRVCAYDAAGNSSCSDVVEISWPPVQ